MMTCKGITGGLAAAIAVLLQAPTSWAAGTAASESPDFATALARDYQDLADSEHVQGDARDGARYQQRASDAAAGRMPVPEDIASRAAFLDARYVPDLSGARSRLVTALEAGARDRTPAAAARAQSSFDCWLEQASEDLQRREIEACRQSFMVAIAAVEAVEPAAMPLAEAAPVAPAPPPIPGPYVVQFALDAAALDADAMTLLAKVQREADAASASGLRLVGHASRAGSETYNMRLSQRRADAVKSALLDGGMREDGIVTEARGEADTLVETADGMREPRNRRVEISLER